MPMALTNVPASLSDVPDQDTVVELARSPVPTPNVRPRHAQAVSRRPGREQGLALEHLGHAVEYLIDSRMFLTGIAYTRSEEQALQILMAASREVFETCPEIVSWSKAASTRLLRCWNAMFARTNVAGRS